MWNMYQNKLRSQHGAALILMVFLLGLGFTAYLIKSFTADSLKLQQALKTQEELGEAKKALIAWAVNNSHVPGLMPYPDRNSDNPNFYDGKSDCYTTTTLDGNYDKLLGKLPWLAADDADCTNLIPGIGQEFKDSSNEHFWYAVSRNVVYDYFNTQYPIINPDIINSPTYPWMEVYDNQGQLISNRVVAVIIAPGAPLDDQDRSSGVSGASDYLDRFDLQSGGGTKSNRTYAIPDEDFYISENSQNIGSSNPLYQQPYYFNDKLTYITIDELMEALQQRVGEVVRSELKEYQDINGYYPYAAQLGTTTNYSGEQNSAGTGGTTSGFLPVNYQSCTATFASGVSNSTSLSCLQPIFDSASSGVAKNSGVTQIRITKTGGGSNFTGTNGLCTVSLFPTSRCTCTGAGTCSGPDTNVTCSSTGCSTQSSIGTVTYRITGGKFTARTNVCAHTTFPTKNATTGCPSAAAGNAVITCSSAAGTNAVGTFASSADARFDNALPSWFKSNNWQDYVYYHITRPANSTMMVGSTSTEAVVVMTGRTINSSPFASKGSAQSRPSCNARNNYLDSVENADGDVIYDASSAPILSNYNDQNFYIKP